jgi:hypothetical protein
MPPVASQLQSRLTNKMPDNIYKSVNGFPHPTIVPINGLPTYKSKTEISPQLTSANAALVQSNLSDGPLRLLYLTVSSAEYNTLSAVALVLPTNPGTTPQNPGE